MKSKIGFREPARRHRCEECSTIFECHLCTIRMTHVLHKDAAKPSVARLFFVCEDCIVANGLQRVATDYRYYDHFTGKRVGRSIAARRTA